MSGLLGPIDPTQPQQPGVPATPGLLGSAATPQRPAVDPTGGWDTGPGPSQDLQNALIQLFQAQNPGYGQAQQAIQGAGLGATSQGGKWQGPMGAGVPTKQQVTDYFTQAGDQHMQDMLADRNSPQGNSGGRG
jgi:hypothetical protein